MVLSNASSTWDMWVSPPVQPIISIYIFNYTNLDCLEVPVNTTRERGYCTKFPVQQIGPYVYRYVRELETSQNTLEFGLFPSSAEIDSLIKRAKFDSFCASANSTRFHKRWLWLVLYREKTEKVNITFNDDSTISFRENKTYEFVPQSSVGDPQEDIVVVPNIPYMVSC